MKNINTIMKIISALAAVVGAVYIVAVYGDKIVAWAKQLLGYSSEPIATLHFTTPESEAAQPAENAPAEEASAAEAPAEAAPVEEAPVAAPETPATGESIPVANEEDFEG